MPKVTSYAQGAPAWVDLRTPDVDAALGFYSQLFGWEDDPQELPDGMGHYHIQTLGGEHVAAIAAQWPDEAARGAPPLWSTYLAVDDVDAAAARVAGAGGSLMGEPMDVMEAGRMAWLQDPAGASVCLWQANLHVGATVRGDAGSLCWHELHTADPAGAARFLGRLLGVAAREEPLPDGSPYVMLSAGGEDVAGIPPAPPDAGGAPPRWLAYFAVGDTAAAAARVRELGGSVIMEPTESPGGPFAVVADPQGAAFGVVQPGGQPA